MLLSELYRYILLIVVSYFTINQYYKYKYSINNNSVIQEYDSDIWGLGLCLFFIFLIGLRPMGSSMGWQWGDSVNYYMTYKMLEGCHFKLDLFVSEPIWSNLFSYWCSSKMGINSLFLLCDSIYFGCTYIACRKWFHSDSCVAYLAFLGALSTYSYSYNGVRAGVAGAIFILGIAYYENKWLSIILVLISWGFHHSMQLPVAAYVLTMFFKNPKWYFYGWFFCVLMAFLHISFFQNLFAGMTDESGSSYLSRSGDGSDGTVGGFRLDFILYSAAPVWIGYNIIMNEQRQVSNLYLTLLNLYLCTNGIWMLCMYASFTNRIAYLSWFMYPFVLIYPFLKEDLTDCLFLNGEGQHSFFSKVLVYHLGFTLFMSLIFYKFIK